MVNKLEIKEIPLYNYWDMKKKGKQTLYGYHPQPVIDGKALGDVINEHMGELLDYDCKLLALTYEKRLDFEYCDRFTDWFLSLRCDTVIPLMQCDTDLDYTCTVIAAHMRFDEDYAYMDEISLVNRSLMQDDSAYGIADFGSYTDEDWEKYGTSIAFEKVGSLKWNNWVMDNFQEEMFRRLKNYYYPFIQNRDNLIRICKPNFKFDIHEYEAMLDFYDKKAKASF